MYCDECKGPIKPNIVFYGQDLSTEFYKFIKLKSLDKIDLVLILGTQMTVTPFNTIPNNVRNSIPKVLFNVDSDALSRFSTQENTLIVEGKPDDLVFQLCRDIDQLEKFNSVLP
jgi:NAD-dependent histone deacetylase SIR2